MLGSNMTYTNQVCKIPGVFFMQYVILFLLSILLTLYLLASLLVAIFTAGAWLLSKALFSYIYM